MLVSHYPRGCCLLLNKIWHHSDGKVVLGSTDNEKSDMLVGKRWDFTFNSRFLGNEGVAEVLIFKYLSLDQRFGALRFAQFYEVRNAGVDAAGQPCAALVGALNREHVLTEAVLHKGREFKILLAITVDSQPRIP